VNCGCGGSTDLDAALDALDSGQFAGVGLDGFDPEPPEYHAALVDRPNVVRTPNLMGLGRQATAATFADAAPGIVDVLVGRPPAGVTNPKWTQAQPLRQD
jgi:D-3-phosphoglycerate dehydrogenase